MTVMRRRPAPTRMRTLEAATPVCVAMPHRSRASPARLWMILEGAAAAAAAAGGRGGGGGAKLREGESFRATEREGAWTWDRDRDLTSSCVTSHSLTGGVVILNFDPLALVRGSILSINF